MFLPETGKVTWRSHLGHDRDHQVNCILLADPSTKLKFFIDAGADISVLPVSMTR